MNRLICLLLGSALILLAPAYAGVRADVSEGVAVLESARCRVELDAETGALLGIRPGPDSLRGPWFEVVEEDRRGWRPWETWERGAESVFTGDPAEVLVRTTNGGAQARARWRRPNGLIIVGEVELSTGDAGPRFRIRVSNTTGQALVDTLRAGSAAQARLPRLPVHAVARPARCRTGRVRRVPR